MKIKMFNSRSNQITFSILFDHHPHNNAMGYVTATSTLLRYKTTVSIYQRERRRVEVTMIFGTMKIILNSLIFLCVFKKSLGIFEYISL